MSCSKNTEALIFLIPCKPANPRKRLHVKTHPRMGWTKTKVAYTGQRSWPTSDFLRTLYLTVKRNTNRNQLSTFIFFFTQMLDNLFSLSTHREIKVSKTVYFLQKRKPKKNRDLKHCSEDYMIHHLLSCFNAWFLKPNKDTAMTHDAWNSSIPLRFFFATSLAWFRWVRVLGA